MEFRIKPNVTLTKVSNESVAFDTSDGSCHILNETAGWLLSICTDFMPLSEAVGLAQNHYKIPAEIAPYKEISEIVHEMASKGLLETKA